MEEHISELPEECVSNILSLTSPQDACTSSSISSTFKSALGSDVVWEKFLPDDYKDIVARSVTLLDLNTFGSKKDLYFKLCDEPLLIDGGSKSFSLDKKSGKKCFMIGARELNLFDAGQSWKWISLDESRFAEVAQLSNISILYITGGMDTEMLSVKTTYEIYLVIKFTDEAFGLDFPAAMVSVYFPSGEGSASGDRTVYLDPSFQTHGEWRSSEPELSSETPVTWCQYPRMREDGWVEVVMGEFYNDEEVERVEVILNSPYGHNKGGLIVQGIELRPKAN